MIKRELVLGEFSHYAEKWREDNRIMLSQISETLSRPHPYASVQYYMCCGKKHWGKGGLCDFFSDASSSLGSL